MGQITGPALTDELLQLDKHFGGRFAAGSVGEAK